MDKEDDLGEAGPFLNETAQSEESEDISIGLLFASKAIVQLLGPVSSFLISTGISPIIHPILDMLSLQWGNKKWLLANISNWLWNISRVQVLLSFVGWPCFREKIRVTWLELDFYENWKNSVKSKHSYGNIYRQGRLRITLTYGADCDVFFNPYVLTIHKVRFRKFLDFSKFSCKAIFPTSTVNNISKESPAGNTNHQRHWYLCVRFFFEKNLIRSF